MREPAIYSLGHFVLDQLRRHALSHTLSRKRVRVVTDRSSPSKTANTEGGDEVSAEKTSPPTTGCDNSLAKKASIEECDTEPVAKRVMTETVVKLCRYCNEEPSDEMFPPEGKHKFCYDCFIGTDKVPLKDGKGPCLSCRKTNAANWRGALIRFPGRRVCLTCYDSLMTAQRKNKELIEQLRNHDPALDTYDT